MPNQLRLVIAALATASCPLILQEQAWIQEYSQTVCTDALRENVVLYNHFSEGN